MPVRLEKAAEVDCLAAPEVSVDAPVERKLQRLPVKAPACASVSAGCRRRGGSGVQDVLLGAHGDGSPSSRVRGGRGVCGVWPQCLVVVVRELFDVRMRCRLGITVSWKVHSSDWMIRDVRTGALLQLQQFPHNTFTQHLLLRLVPSPFGFRFSWSAVSHPSCRVNSVSAACPAHCAPQPCAQVLALLPGLPRRAATLPSREQPRLAFWARFQGMQRR